jgi:putative SOS response-associated peptidase YedK
LRDERPFFFAGLCDSWKRPDGTALESFTIITTEANSLVRSVHDRMPVMLTETGAREWLNRAERVLEGLSPLLAPFPAEQMESYPVSPRVNDPKLDDPQCVEREERPDGMLPGFSNLP